MLDTSTLSRDSSLNQRKRKIEEIPSYKVLIIGDPGIGKTSLIHRYIYNEFKEHNESTIGLDFQEKTVQVSPEDKIILIIWDTAGSEKFHSIAQNFFTNCDGIILCFDTTDKKTFENLESWINYIISCLSKLIEKLGYSVKKINENVDIDVFEEQNQVFKKVYQDDDLDNYYSYDANTIRVEGNNVYNELSDTNIKTSENLI